MKRELDLTKLELDTLSTQVPKLQKRFQKSFRERESLPMCVGGGRRGVEGERKSSATSCLALSLTYNSRTPLSQLCSVGSQT